MKWFWLVLVFLLQKAMAYDQPHVDLGYHNILVGGPLIPRSGLYVQDFPQYYYTNRFLDAKGKRVGGVPSPALNTVANILEVLYQTARPTLLNGKWGILGYLPAVLYSQVEKNDIGVSTSGAGLGDVQLGVFLQWDTINVGDRPVFAHRVAFNVSFPTGKFEAKKSINPGNGIYYISPYWAGTLYLTPQWTTSWTLHYLWNAENGKRHIQGGQSFYVDYSMAYEAVKGFWPAIVGYYFQQFEDNRFLGIPIPDSKQRIFAIGPGAFYSVTEQFKLFGFLYFETAVQNETQGINFIGRLFYHF